MATIGTQLLKPEDGWTRFDNSDANISYIGAGWFDDGTYTPYGGTRKSNQNNVSGRSIQFGFKGTRLRVIGILSTNWSNNLQINIDGKVESFTQNGPVTTMILNYEKTGLANTVHNVQITNLGEGFWGLDAIDIDEKEGLCPLKKIQVPENLTALAGDAVVKLEWKSVPESIYYVIKRATKAGGPYTTIASNVTGMTYYDNSVVNGTTYYYVVTATTANGESDNSNEATATPIAGGYIVPVIEKGFLLTVNMDEDIEREYVMTAEKINAFVTWFNAKAGGVGPAVYVIDKSFKRKDYVVFDRIVTFEVADYSI